MAGVTRGFVGRRDRNHDPRLPPGQYDAGNSWPVLTAEAEPRLSPEEWDFTLDGLVAHPTTWSWDEAHALPASVYEGAIHCVTTWSKFDMRWTGVSLDTLFAIAQPLDSATHVVARCVTGYTTNLPLVDVMNGQAWLAWEVDGAPLSRAHGGPVRLLVPHLYFWKSAKWITGMSLLDHDEPGFWERYGYHNHGDPWAEERYQGD